MQIGDKVWIFDSNKRSYVDDKGNKLDRCWYKYHFDERYIIGETKVSWIIGYESNKIENKNNIKVNKKTLEYPYQSCLNGILYISEEQIDRVCWIEENKYKIRDMVGMCKDYDKLKKIKEILDSE